MQKAGLSKNITGILGCPDEFYRYDYYERWVADQMSFLKFILSNASNRPENIVLLGVSEGCLTAMTVAVRATVVTHLAMIGCGGMRFIDELRLLREKGWLHFDIDGHYREIMSAPYSTDRFFAGYTYRYWSSSLEVDPMKYLLNLDIPIIATMGKDDRHTPIESLIFLRDKFNSLGRKNLTVIIYPSANHYLESPQKNYRHDFMKKLSEWIYATGG